MAKKSDSFYFGNFYACADCAYQAAHLLERVMRDFDPLLIREKLDDMHKVEHAADEKKARGAGRSGQGVHHPHRAGGHHPAQPEHR